MATSLQNFPSLHRALFSKASSHQLALQNPVVLLPGRRRPAVFQVKAEAAEASPSFHQESIGRRQTTILGAIATCISLSPVDSEAFAAEIKKGFQTVLDKKDGYSFLYPFGWQEVVIQGQDKVFKDVIEPLESVSVNMIETNKKDIRELGAPKEVAEALIKRVLAPSTQKTKLIEALEV